MDLLRTKIKIIGINLKFELSKQNKVSEYWQKNLHFNFCKLKFKFDKTC